MKFSLLRYHSLEFKATEKQLSPLLRSFPRIAQSIGKLVVRQRGIDVRHSEQSLCERIEACWSKARATSILFPVGPRQFPPVMFHRGGVMQADNNMPGSKTRLGNTWDYITYRDLHV